MGHHGGGAQVGCLLSHIPMHAWRRSCPTRCVIYSIWWWIPECADISISICFYFLWIRCEAPWGGAQVGCLLPNIPMHLVYATPTMCCEQRNPAKDRSERPVGDDLVRNCYHLLRIRVRHHGGELTSAACFPTLPCMHGANHVQNVALFISFGCGSQNVVIFPSADGVGNSHNVL